MPRQLTFMSPTTVTKIYPDGTQERLKYGQFEAVMIVSENGMPANRTSYLMPPRYPVTEVKCIDGSTLIFDKPFYNIEEKGFGIKAYLIHVYGETGYHDKVSQIAKTKWEKAGRPENKNDHFWLEAEKALENLYTE